jgi:hypothetical protein
MLILLMEGLYIRSRGVSIGLLPAKVVERGGYSQYNYARLNIIQPTDHSSPHLADLSELGDDLFRLEMS